MLNHNQALIAGLKQAISEVERLDERGVEVRGGFVVFSDSPRYVGPIYGSPGKRLELPFGSRTKEVQP